MRGPFRGIRALAPVMAAGGAIINVGSAAAISGGLPGSSAYVSSKWALRGLTRTAAIECGPLRIRVNIVSPRRDLHAYAAVDQGRGKPSYE